MRLNDGLRKLGESAFSSSSVADIRLPSTLKRLEAKTFCCCKNLRSVEIPNGVEHIGERCFALSGIEEIALPSSLKEIGEGAFSGCDRLRVVRVEEDCTLDIRRYVNDNV